MSDPKKSILPPGAAVFIARAKAFFSTLSKGARVLLISTAGLAAIFVGYLVFHAANEPYATLFSQLDRDDASAVVAKLKEMKVPYKLSADGGTIEVPEKQALDLRLELASSGLPRGGGVGFESFDKMRLGATEFEQRVLYRRALEGELSRTIDTIGAVQSSRVHLVMPEKSVFVSRTEPASASIVVKLKPGHTLGPQEVAGVVHLAASAVPGLAAESVTLVTTEGQMLHRPRKQGDDENASDDPNQVSAAKQLETTLSDRAREMIERIVGPGHVDVQVSADVDTARVEHVEDHYNPASAVMRSEEATLERQSTGVDDTVAGVPGAESNLPSGATVGAASATKPGAKPATSATPSASASAAPSVSIAAASLPAPVMSAQVAHELAPGVMRESHTRNFEIDHVSDKRTLPPGAVRRLAVAVVVDGVEVTEAGKNKVVERDPEQMAKIAALVRGAVGIDEKRGDVLTVESVPFLADHADAPATTDAPAKPFDLHFDPKQHVKALAAAGGATLLLFALVMLALRKRRRAAAATALALERAKTDEKMLQFGAAAASQIEITKAPEDVRMAAHERAALDPATAALVLKAWLGANESEEKLERVA